MQRLLLVLVAAISISSPVHAEPSPVTAAEWQYLQQVDLVAKVGETVWTVFESSGGQNRALNEQARDITRLNLMTLRRTTPPAPELQDLHWLMIEGLELATDLYDEVALGNFKRANQLGEQLQAKMAGIQEAWKPVAARYPEPDGEDD